MDFRFCTAETLAAAEKDQFDQTRTDHGDPSGKF